MSTVPVSQNADAAVETRPPGLSDQLDALKIKIAALEAQIDATPSELDKPDNPRVAQVEQYRRMEQCLYNHRKEWEGSGGPGSWRMFPEPRHYGQPMPNGPWTHTWYIDSDQRYRRPDPFDPSHQCEMSNGGANDAPVPDDFDYIIDYGDRRERLRKNFEWEMDRLFLAEEMERRRRAKSEAMSKKSASNNIAHPASSSQSTEENIEAAKDELDVEPEALIIGAAPKLNRLEWPLFQYPEVATNKDSCVIDVLVGDSIAQDNAGAYQTRYPDLGRRIDAFTGAQDRLDCTKPMSWAQTSLPERVRIHSIVLLRILYRILGSEGTSLVNDRNFPVFTNPIVLNRPFKVLVYCENGLRNWCSSLEKQIYDDSDAQKLLGGPGSPSAAKEISEEHKEDRNKLTKSPIALEHLKCLLSFIDTDISPRQKYLSGQDCQKVFFSDLWLLFRPGTEVISNNGKQAYRVIYATNDKHHTVTTWQQGWYGVLNAKHHRATFKVTCMYIDFDGKHLGPVTKDFEFKSFDGDKDITSFEVYPLRLRPVDRCDFTESEWKDLEEAPEDRKYRRKLVNRGRKFIEVAAVKHMYYAGPTLITRDEVESQVVVDFETAFSQAEQHQHKPDLQILLGNPTLNGSKEDEAKEECRGPCCRDDGVHDDSYVDQKQRTDYIEGILPKAHRMDHKFSPALMPRSLEDLRLSAPKDGQFVSDDDLVIMSHRVFGFILRSRKWAQLDLACLTDVHPPEAPGILTEEEGNKDKEPTAFDRLVLEKGHRPMIVSLIAQHFRDKQSVTGQKEHVDIVKGKGRGLILLLHGAPGVGKTSTAEGVAELFRKPLLQITCGDLGTTAKEVEEALEVNFNMANRWGCILLLDEADVFLSERTKEDFKRNGLVAAFLRVLEYYAGILFLTTNRIGDFDEAFTSRIHISLYYPSLNQNKTVEVFKVNMDMIEERFIKKGRQIDIDKVGIGSFACQHYTEFPKARWNGRQIRNACQTALALAEFEAQGNNSTTIQNTDASVTLRAEHFKVVRDAYLEFSRYMNDLYGSSASRRAKEAKIRAIWVDENDRVVATQGGTSSNTMDRKAAFLLASQGQSQHTPELARPPSQVFVQQQDPEQNHSFLQHPSLQPTIQQHRPLQPGGIQQHASLQTGVQHHATQQEPQYFAEYQNMAAPRPGYRQSNPVQMQMQQTQQFMANQNWASLDGSVVTPQFRGADEVQIQGQSQTSLQAQTSQPPLPQPQQQPQQQRQPGQPWFNQNIQDIYTASDK